jgi:hypothetical protein
MPLCFPTDAASLLDTEQAASFALPRHLSQQAGQEAFDAGGAFAARVRSLYNFPVSCCTAIVPRT